MTEEERDELLIRIDERVSGLPKRVRMLEIAVAVIATSGGISIGVLT